MDSLSRKKRGEAFKLFQKSVEQESPYFEEHKNEQVSRPQRVPPDGNSRVRSDRNGKTVTNW